jgi:peptidoglycan/xylan/chitin deacetylase (PgdA/CDA1 family)
MKQQIVQLFKSIAGSAEYNLRPWKYASNELIVLCMHSTPFDRREQMERLLDFILSHFRALDPKQLADYFDGKLTNGPYVLFTFDDGLKNNAHAAELLEKRDARAVFFVVPDFVDAADGVDYYRKNIRQVIDPLVDHEQDDFSPLSVNQLKALQAKGHCVESHTMSHLLRSKSSPSEIEREVSESKRWLQRNLMSEATMFCSPIQTNFSVNAFAKRRIDEDYLYHFTTFPGLNGELQNPRLIFRRNIEVHWSLGQVKYALGKADLARWKDEISRFQRL